MPPIESAFPTADTQRSRLHAAAPPAVSARPRSTESKYQHRRAVGNVRPVPGDAPLTMSDWRGVLHVQRGFFADSDLHAAVIACHQTFTSPAGSDDDDITSQPQKPVCADVGCWAIPEGHQRYATKAAAPAAITVAQGPAKSLTVV